MKHIFIILALLLVIGGGLYLLRSDMDDMDDSFTCGDTLSYHEDDYDTVEIGDQCWMAENLKTTTYRDGTKISNIKNEDEWKVYEGGARAAYDNDEDNVDTYGYFYNWKAVNSEAGLCPEGWSVPTDEQWHILEDHLADNSCDGERGTEHATEGSDCAPAGAKMAGGYDLWQGVELKEHRDFGESGFNVLPGGGLHVPGSIGFVAHFWSSSESGSDAWRRSISAQQAVVNRSDFSKEHGFSVRCLKD